MANNGVWDKDGTPSRRSVLLTAGAALSIVSTAACDVLSTSPTGDRERNDAADSNANEAPDLAGQVEAGTLPPLEQRLPTNPAIVEPVDRVGVYGGQWRSFVDRQRPPYLELGYDYLLRWDPEFREILPNLAESWDVEDEGRTYVLRLRKGVKWSDGEPFTTGDIVFAQNDLLNNRELYPGEPDNPVHAEAEDEHTVRFVFDNPAGLFPDSLASAGGQEYVTSPKHYFEQFHPDYNAELDSLIESEGVTDWVELFQLKAGTGVWSLERWRPEVPTLFAWHTQTPLLEDQTRSVFVRNPYYWKTDPGGSQLPYLDRAVFEFISDPEVGVLKATNGEYEFVRPTFAGGITALQNKPVYAKSREEGNYDFVDGLASTMNHMVIGLNLTHRDPALRDVMRNKDFRIGLSYAINRQEIIDSVYQQQGEPWQAAPRRESPFYDEALAKQYTEYDVDKANEHLDRAGYVERQDDIRLRPDGKPISFAVSITTQEDVAIDALELIKEYWRDVGVEMRVSAEERSLFGERRAANQHDASTWTGDGGLYDAVLDPRWYFPFSDESNFAIMWANWFMGAEPGEEPTQAARRQMELYRTLRATMDRDQQQELFMQILQIAKEEFWAIGTVLPVGTYGIVKNNFHNVPEPMIVSFRWPTPGPTHPEQYFATEE